MQNGTCCRLCITRSSHVMFRCLSAGTGEPSERARRGQELPSCKAEVCSTSRRLPFERRKHAQVPAGSRRLCLPACASELVTYSHAQAHAPAYSSICLWPCLSSCSCFCSCRCRCSCRCCPPLPLPPAAAAAADAAHASTPVSHNRPTSDLPTCQPAVVSLCSLRLCCAPLQVHLISEHCIPLHLCPCCVFLMLQRAQAWLICAMHGVRRNLRQRNRHTRCWHNRVVSCSCVASRRGSSTLACIKQME